MSKVWVVPAFDPGEQLLVGLVACFEGGLVEEFAFEGGEERFGHGVVVAVSNGSHRWDDTVTVTVHSERYGGVLGSLVGVVYYPSGGSLVDRHVEGCRDEFGA